MNRVELRFDSSPQDMSWHPLVHERLAELTAEARIDGVAGMLLPTAVIEAINNIIQHAYRNAVGRPIVLQGIQDGTALTVVLRDRGEPMPLPLPRGDLPDETAECGRGWRIIRSVFPEVRYRRIDGENVLTLSHPVAALTAPGNSTHPDRPQTQEDGA